MIARRVFAALAILGCAGAAAAPLIQIFYGNDHGVTVIAAVCFAIGVLGYAVEKSTRS